MCPVGVVATLLIGFSLVVILSVSLLDRGWRNRAAAQRQWLDHQRRISRLARRDSLTGLPNRVHLQRLLPRLLARAARDRTRLALLNLDLDHFKNVNDSLGHGIGDKLLSAVADRLRASTASHDIVVRLGGDEFVVVATMLPDAAVVARIAEQSSLIVAVGDFVLRQVCQQLSEWQRDLVPLVPISINISARCRRCAISAREFSSTISVPAIRA